MNSHIVIGTAGHVDHGKTAFIRHLTGIETDRLKDEKERGITIENGYAHLDLPNGYTVGFVDVPGHERFIKTMLAGAMGMDAVILIISAEEGIKPQTIEHFNIIKHLNITKGFVLITKCDLVEKDALIFLEEEIREMLSNTCFEHADILHYSIYDNAYREAVIQSIVEITKSDFMKDEHVASRLNVDRVFSVKGFGTVVTGTLIEGRIDKGMSISHYPSGQKCRVKGIQVYGKSVEMASYGQRTALNITLDIDEVTKGDTLTSIENFMPTMIIDVLLKTDSFVTDISEIKHWQRIKLYHGTREILCRIVTGTDKSIGPNSERKVQLRLESPLYCKANDPFIIRSYSPMITLGGGLILTPHAQKRVIEDAEVEAGNLEIDALIHALKRSDFIFTLEDSLFENTSFSKEKGYQLFNELIEKKEIRQLKDNRFLLSNNWEAMVELIVTEALAEHKAFPLRAGIQKETLKSKLTSKLHKVTINKNDFSAILENLIKEDILLERGNFIAIKDFKIDYTAQEKHMIDSIISLANNHPQGLFTQEDVLKLNFNKNNVKELLYHLINYEILVKINDETIMSMGIYNTCKARLLEFFEGHTELSVAEYRDLIGFSRKAAVILLEHFDRIQLTKRNENTRTLIK